MRKITIKDFEYFYIVSNKYHLETKTNTLTLKVFLKGEKQTPLIIDFLTIDDLYMGQILNSGVELTNIIKNSVDNVNINEPNYIRALILIGQKKGWTGTNKLELQNG